MDAIVIKNLSFCYDEDFLAVDRINLTIPKGKYISIVGHNGSGKSTLAKLLLGLLKAKEGTIEILGMELNEKNVTSIRRKVGIVFQNPDNQFIGSTVADDLAFGLENRCIPQNDMQPLILEFATKVNMQDFLDKEPTNLSGGQKQRVAIAGVLAMHPEIIIFDEATVMLDPKGRRDIASLILEMRKENPSLTIISITHDMEEASLSDEVIVLDHGKVVAKGKPLEVLSNAQLLKSIDLKMPFLAELRYLLKVEGIEVEETNSFEEMVVNVCR